MFITENKEAFPCFISALSRKRIVIKKTLFNRSSCYLVHKLRSLCWVRTLHFKTVFPSWGKRPGQVCCACFSVTCERAQVNNVENASRCVSLLNESETRLDSNLKFKWRRATKIIVCTRNKEKLNNIEASFFKAV